MGLCWHTLHRTGARKGSNIVGINELYRTKVPLTVIKREREITRGYESIKEWINDKSLNWTWVRTIESYITC